MAGKKTAKSKAGLSIKARLFISLSLILLVFILVAIFNFLRLGAVERHLDDLELKASMSDHALKLAIESDKLYGCFTDVYVFNDAKAMERFNSEVIQYQSTLNALRGCASEQCLEDIELLEAFINNIISQFENNLVMGFQTGEQPRMRVAIDKAKEIISVQSKSIDRIIAAADQEHKLSTLEIQSILSATNQSFLLGTILVVILCIFISLLLSRSVSGPLKDINAVVGSLAHGDFSTRLSTKKTAKEVKQLFDSFEVMQNNLKRLIKSILSISEMLNSSSSQLALTAEQTSQSAQQVSATVEELASGSQEQQQHVTKTVDIVGNTAESIAQVSHRSKEMASSAKEVIGTAVLGKKSMDQMTSQMGAITEKVDASAVIVASLKEHSQHIEEFIQIITTIAEQTNLLALNAAIEAARAGEQGRGFAVVADEVRNLAEQSNEAASRIAQLVERIQVETDEAAASMQDSTKEVGQGTAVANQSSQQFEEIFKQVNQLANYIHELEGAAKDIDDDSGKMVEAVNNISAITQQASAGLEEVSATSQEQTAGMEEVASAANELASLAHKLEDATKSFKV